MYEKFVSLSLLLTCTLLDSRTCEIAGDPSNCDSDLEENRESGKMLTLEMCSTGEEKMTHLVSYTKNRKN